ncbi:hypothetical protein MLD38_031226 [Melastoma candidum]|uniref:Uncharacterized protein n=1 Tax=Melastoma candidum TaxID=119954 RepID=A0ACB9MQM7_9MYRT|nr:hypothetical protein MLD38_031226 [Melastoma candidum]
MWKDDDCGFFSWYDEVVPPRQKEVILYLVENKKMLEGNIQAMQKREGEMEELIKHLQTELRWSAQIGLAGYRLAVPIVEKMAVACSPSASPPSSTTPPFTPSPPSPTPLDALLSSLSLSSSSVRSSLPVVQSLLRSSPGDLNLSSHSKNCLNAHLPLSLHRLSLASSALSRPPLPLPETLADTRVYVSAALQYVYDCWSELSYSNTSSRVDRAMAFLESVIQITSNSLSILTSYDVYGPVPSSWRAPLTERDGFWEPVRGPKSPSEHASTHDGLGVGLGRTTVIPTDAAADATVCKEGHHDGCYGTVQEAVNAAPNWHGGSRKNEKGQRFVIKIKAGFYEEVVRVPLEKRNVVFLGDGIGKTVISGDLSVARPGVFTYNTAIVGVQGDGFMASGITFQNTAGPDVHQAVAFRSDSDLSVVENCEFLGNQDTLYVRSHRQLYRFCRVEGNVDFIFGNAAAIFQGCTILVRPRQLNPEKGENNAVTAHGRTDPAQPTGLVFENCLINGTERYIELYKANPKVHRNFLGRPWKEYSRTVFIRCEMDEIITREGWMPFREDFALKTLYYGEFGNTGPGSIPSGRVWWSSRIPTRHVDEYSPENFIQASQWIPSSP